MSEKQNAFLLFSIGPVQEFIATARRTHDLWAGSRLLSLLMVSALQKAQGATPVFPLPNEQGEWPKSVPNRAVLTVESTAVGVEIGRKMVTAVHEKWHEIEVEVRKRFTKYAPNPESWGNLWEQQNENWLEYYWITWEQEGSYNIRYRTASDMLSARKLLRPISVRAEGGEKCTLSGVMTALPGAAADRQQIREFWNEVRANVRVAKDVSDTAVRRGEQLCALSVVKRFAEADQVLQDKEKQRFPSTSSVAAADFRLAVVQNWDALRELVGKWVTAVAQLELPVYKTKEPVACLNNAASDKDARHFLLHDGDYLYPDFYTEPRILEAIGEDKQGRLDGKQLRAMRKARQMLLNLYDKCQALNITPPSPYYALLKMDGDEMGSTLSEKIENVEKHRVFSRRLALFAQTDVPRIVEEEAPGALVYAGGDDALALLPVSAALPVAEKLRMSFAEKLSDPTEGGWGEVHASVGLVFVHHQAPLQTAVRQAATMEGIAKHGYGRNAIAIRLLRRSGEPHEMGSKWLVNNPPLSVVAIMNEVRQEMMDGNLATKFAYEVMEEADALSTLPQKAFTVECGRLLYRHWDEKTRKEPSRQKYIEQITEQLVAVAMANGVSDLGRWLILMAFLAKRGGEM